MKMYMVGRIEITYTGKRLTRIQYDKLEGYLDTIDLESAMEDTASKVLNHAVEQSGMKAERFDVKVSF